VQALNHREKKIVEERKLLEAPAGKHDALEEAATKARKALNDALEKIASATSDRDTWNARLQNDGVQQRGWTSRRSRRRKRVRVQLPAWTALPSTKPRSSALATLRRPRRAATKRSSVSYAWPRALFTPAAAPST
jgi:hypothetical protein